jgi:aquaporin Z
MAQALRRHWPEYLMEAAELGLFMISACLFGVLLEHPTSPLRQMILNDDVRRLMMGIAMGLTAVGIIYSPLGKRSGGHFNPAVTLTFYRLGKIDRHDAAFYAVAQFAGAVAGVLLAATVVQTVADPEVNYVATVPGPAGVAVAFGAEALISFVLMATILTVSNSARIAHLTPVFAGFLVATCITLEGPISGMSMNPARTFGSALPANVWTALWIYFIAPPLGMLLAAELFTRRKGVHAALCAKLHHNNHYRCIFRCNYGMG